MKTRDISINGVPQTIGAQELQLGVDGFGALKLIKDTVPDDETVFVFNSTTLPDLNGGTLLNGVATLDDDGDMDNMYSNMTTFLVGPELMIFLRLKMKIMKLWLLVMMEATHLPLILHQMRQLPVHLSISHYLDQFME